MNYRHLLVLGTILFVSIHAFSQNPIFDQIRTHSKNQYKSYHLFKSTPQYLRNQNLVQRSVRHCDFLTLNAQHVDELQHRKEDRIQIPISFRNETLNMQLMKADIFSESFVINTSSGQSLCSDNSLFYWGVLEGHKNSLVAITIYKDQISGIIANENQILNLVKHSQEDQYLLFEQNDILIDNPFDCFVDESIHTIHTNNPGIRSNLAGADNCVNVYVEVDNDLVSQQGSAQAAADYVMGAFSQVAILYANEAINMTISELFVWDGNDPYSGPSTSNYLDQFMSELNGQFNGDLAHLVGTQGGGGIAYVDVLCNKSFAVAYSDLNNSYNDFPVYSWTVMVLAHEMGHNLGSPHTHSCAWNGNDTAIDGCGTSLGYSGCPGDIPDAGTIMSYCHLISGVGIDFNLGFGPQPGDLIRNRVYNAGCLGACSEPVALDASITNILAPTGNICGSTETPVVTLANFGTNSLTTASIQYNIDGGSVSTFNWAGTLANNESENVALPDITITTGNHTFSVTITNPNGVTDQKYE